MIVLFLERWLCSEKHRCYRDALQEALQQGGQKADAAAAAGGAAKPVKAATSHYDVLGSDGSDSSSDDEQ